MFPDLSLVGRTVLVFAIMASFPTQTMGEQVNVTPSLAVKEEYNDNIFFTTSDKTGDFITTLTPSLQFLSRTGRREASLTGGINWLKYARFSGDDSVDYFVNGAFGYKITPRLDFSAGAGYTRNSRPDQINTDTGLSINSGSGVQSYQASGNYVATERTKLSLSYGYSREDYDRPDLMGNQQHQAVGGISYTISPNTNLVEKFTFNRQTTDVSEVNNYSVTIGLSNRFMELWSLSMSAGGRYTRSDLKFAGLTTQSGGDLGWVGNLAFYYNGEHVNSIISFNHDVTMSAGRSGSTERTGGSFSLGDRITGKLFASAGLGYFRNKSNRGKFSVQTIDENTLDVNCLLRYDIGGDAALEADYRYVSIDYNASHTKAYQNVFMLRLIMRHEAFL